MDENLLLEKIKAVYADTADIVLKAYAFAKEAHAGQKRNSGEDYFSHPCAVVEILTDFGFDATTAAAAFLHDVLEDTSVTAEILEREFGREILEIVEGVTKLDKLKFLSREDAQAENFRKMFFAMAKDMRVIIIKFADRLHNIRSLKYQPVEKQMYTAQETLDIYAPLAGRLGMSFFKCELEDIAMQYIYPKEFKFIDNYVKSRGAERQLFLDTICAELREVLERLDIKGEVNGRPKHYYSIFKKMRQLGINIDQIYDLLAIRIIVNDVKECYTMLGEVHNMWKPIPGRMKDYIAMPKANNYQSLHTTVMTKFNETFEIQIRTVEMHKIAEYGIAAHWKYKEGLGSKESILESKVRWLREVMDAEKDIDNAKEFMAAVKINVFDDEVFVFSPKGDVYGLPVGSTPVDLAYKIHSAIGNKCVGAKINKKIVPLSTKLQTGDIVEILTSNTAKGPSRDWLNYTQTASARSKIRAFFKKEMKEENIKLGKEILEKEAKRRGYTLSELFATPNALKSFMDRHSLTSLDDLYSAVGFGEISTNQVLLKLIDFFKSRALSDDEAFLKVSKQAEAAAEKAQSQPVRKGRKGILIRGFSDFSVHLSHCCSPVPGDEIIGYVSRGRGVSVHRADCPNVKSMEAERLIEAKWDRLLSDSYASALKIFAENKNGMLADITTAIAKQKIAILGANVKVDKAENTAVIELSIEITSAEQLSEVLGVIRNIKGVIEVKR
jgi:guanosine-3',5'-bis(diphosphate) 3'-pyrophosphohydrolase